MEQIAGELQQAIITVLALGAALGIGWFALGRSVWASIFGENGWFSRLEKRFERVEQAQAQFADGLMEIRGEQKALRTDLKAVTAGQQQHAVQIARLEGRDEARREAAQLASAAGQSSERDGSQGGRDHD